MSPDCPVVDLTCFRKGKHLCVCVSPIIANLCRRGDELRQCKQTLFFFTSKRNLKGIIKLYNMTYDEYDVWFMPPEDPQLVDVITPHLSKHRPGPVQTSINNTVIHTRMQNMLLLITNISCDNMLEAGARTRNSCALYCSVWWRWRLQTERKRRDVMCCHSVAGEGCGGHQ